MIEREWDVHIDGLWRRLRLITTLLGVALRRTIAARALVGLLRLLKGSVSKELSCSRMYHAPEDNSRPDREGDLVIEHLVSPPFATCQDTAAKTSNKTVHQPRPDLLHSSRSQQAGDNTPEIGNPAPDAQNLRYRLTLGRIVALLLLLVPAAVVILRAHDCVALEGSYRAWDVVRGKSKRNIDCILL